MAKMIDADNLTLKLIGLKAFYESLLASTHRDNMSLKLLIDVIDKIIKIIDMTAEGE